MWLWPPLVALVFGCVAAIVSAQADGAEIFARVLAAGGAGLASGFGVLLLVTLMRPRAR
jgi:hypothetical protein